MATRKNSSSKSAPAKTSTSTPVRNTVIPPKAAPAAAPARKVVTREAIAIRAYEIYRSGTGGSQDENWARAEKELKGL
jgi:hypothetical protein